MLKEITIIKTAKIVIFRFSEGTTGENFKELGKWLDLKLKHKGYTSMLVESDEPIKIEIIE